MAGLVKQLDKVAARSKSSMSYVVYLHDDVKEASKRLAVFAKENKVQAVDLTVNKSGAKSPQGYKLNPKVKHTVLLYEKNKVVGNWALEKIDKKSVTEVLAAATKLLRPEPEEEKEKEKEAVDAF